MQENNESKPRQNFFIRSIKFLFGIIKGYLIFIGLMVTLLPVLFALLVAQFGGTAAVSKLDDSQAVLNGKSGVVTLVLSGELLEHSPDFSSQIIHQFFGGPSGIYLPDLRRSLRKIAINDLVLGLHLDLSQLNGGAAEIAELRQILLEFKGSNKPIHGYASDMDNSTLLIGSVLNHVGMSPAGSVILPGPMFQLMYFGDALKKLGVNVEVIKHGKYKSAFEPFVLNDPSPESLEMYQSMESDLRKSSIGLVAEGRKKSPEVVTGWFSKSIYTSKQALDAGMVDELTYLQESIRFLESTVTATGNVELYELEDFKGIAAAESSSHGETGIGLIEAVGEITMGPGNDDTEGISPLKIIEELKWAAETAEVKSVVMRVSSPGGSAVASDIIWREVKRLAEIKPVVVSMGNVAASGGYYISAPAAKILAESSTITGSIGVIGMLPKFTEFREKYGISFHVVTQTERQKLFSMSASSTEADRQLFGESIDSMYQEFITKVAAGRSLKVEDVDKLAQGRVYTGSQALALGLVDEIGGLQDAFQSAKKLAGLDEAGLYPVLRFEPERLSLAQCLRSPKEFSRCLKQGSRIEVSQMVRIAASAGKNQTKFEVLEARLRRLVQMIESEGALAYWPGAIGDSTVK